MSYSKVELSQVQAVRNSMNSITSSLQSLDQEQRQLLSDCSRKKDEAIESLRESVRRQEDKIDDLHRQIEACRNSMTSGDEEDKDTNARLQSEIAELHESVTECREKIEHYEDKIKQIGNHFEEISSSSLNISMHISGNSQGCSNTVKHLDSIIVAIQDYLS